MLLCDKYAPNSLGAVVGNEEAVKRLLNFAAGTQVGKVGKPIMIYGNSGIGKTAAAHALAYSNGFDLLEFNASDYRDAETLGKRLLPAMGTRNLFNRKILVLFDEIDELSSKYDSGVEAIVLNLVKNSKYPVLFTANDFWNRKIAFLRDHVERLEFKKPKKSDVIKVMENVLAQEGKTMDKKIIDEIAGRSSGDIRGALNDLELMFDSNLELLEYMGTRDRKMEVFAVLDKIFLSSDFDIPRNAVANSDVDLDMLINWVEQNIPSKYLSKNGKREAYEQLSRASMFSEKASRVNYYGYLRYASVILSAGISMANDGAVSMITPYSFPARIRQMSITKKDRNALSEIAAKLSPILHTSKKGVISSYLPMLKVMIDKASPEYDKERIDEFMQGLFRLDADEVDKIREYYQFR